MSSRAPLPALLLLAACGGGEPDPTWWADVRPIVQGRCTSCHSEGGIAPFALDSYAAMRASGPAAAEAVQSRYMPPWRAVPGHIDYAFDPSLSQAQIDTIARWVEAGMPEGDRADSGKPLAPLGQVLPRVDLTLGLPEPYSPSGGEDDDVYRCFLTEWPETELRYVTGFEVIPDNPTVVHHVAAFLIEPDTLAGPGVIDDFHGFDAAEPGPGYTCFGGPSGANDSQAPIQQIAQWVPGNGAVLFPDGSGIPISPGSLVVLQVHYSRENWDGQPDQTTIDFLIEDQVARHGAFAPFLNATWPLGGMTIPDGTTTTHEHRADPVPFFDLMITDIDLSQGFDIQSAMLHMHLAGRHGLLQLERADGSTQVLLEVDPWDFDWQINYQLAEPVRFAPGDQLYLACTWDNQTGATLDWGEGSDEEMCVGNLFITEP